ncbi:MAG: hypothetical protein ACYTGV_00035 [Planctomycetota bacterium]|jgi:hypothetical protein
MGRENDEPLCANQAHVRVERDATEPTNVCSCPSGLIHMQDCPVTLARECTHFREPAGETFTVQPAEFERLHADLMEDFQSRLYIHRVRSLAPEEDRWERYRKELGERYAGAESEEPETEAPDDADDSGYERERERLLAQRRKREQVRMEREEQEKREKAERAREKAERALREAEERRARERAERKEAAPSREEGGARSPEPQGRRRRRRRRRPAGGQAPPRAGAAPAGEGAAREQSRPAGAGGPPAAEGEKPRRKRRRRRRNRRPPRKDGGGGSAPA